MKNDSTNTGIKERCTLNDLPNFHIILSCAVDPMHDIYEGVAQYDLCFLIKHYIYTKKNFFPH